MTCVHPRKAKDFAPQLFYGRGAGCGAGIVPLFEPIPPSVIWAGPRGLEGSQRHPYSSPSLGWDCKTTSGGCHGGSRHSFVVLHRGPAR